MAARTRRRRGARMGGQKSVTAVFQEIVEWFQAMFDWGKWVRDSLFILLDAVNEARVKVGLPKVALPVRTRGPGDPPPPPWK